MTLCDDEELPVRVAVAAVEPFRSRTSTGSSHIHIHVQNSCKCENPFRMTSLDDYRRNFPPFESVFGYDSKLPADDASSSSSSSCQQCKSSLLNLSTSAISTSILSISDRAAMDMDMNVHKRRTAHAQFGSDGDQTTTPSRSGGTNEETGCILLQQHVAVAVAVATFHDVVADQLWAELNCSHLYPDPTKRIQAPDDDVPSSSTSHTRVVVSSGSSPDGSEEIEVLTDVSLALDELFFRSDRVEALRTPERCKTNARALPSPTRRRQGSEHDTNTSTSSSAVESETMAMLRLALAGTARHNTSSSMSSSSSSSSSAFGNEATLLINTSTPWNACQTRPSPKHLYPLPTDLSTSQRVAGRIIVDKDDTANSNGSFLLNQSAISTSSSDHHVQVLQNPHKQPKSWENFQISTNSLEAHTVLSPGRKTSLSSLEVKTTEPVAFHPLSPPRATRFPLKNFTPIDGLGDALSPIRPCKTDDGDDDFLSLVSSKSRTPFRLKGNSLQTQLWNANLDSIDRRLFRTVVPSRVFMSESRDFPMEDSFSPKSVH